jgi:hypothetical protein
VDGVIVDQDGDNTIKEKEFRGSERLWELLKRERANKEHVTSEDLRTYKKIFLLTNAHLEGLNPGGVINVSRGKCSAKSSPNFRVSEKPSCRISVRPCMEKIPRCPPEHYIIILINRQVSRV